MAHITPDGRRLVLTRADLRPEGDSFSIEFPDGTWVELTRQGHDVVLDMTTAGPILEDGDQQVFHNAACWEVFSKDEFPRWQEWLDKVQQACADIADMDIDDLDDFDYETPFRAGESPRAVALQSLANTGFTGMEFDGEDDDEYGD